MFKNSYIWVCTCVQCLTLHYCNQNSLYVSVFIIADIDNNFGLQSLPSSIVHDNLINIHLHNYEQIGSMCLLLVYNISCVL